MKLSDRQIEIMLAIMVGHRTLAALAEQPQFNTVTTRTLQRDLGDLVNNNLLERHGEGRGINYVVSPGQKLELVCPATVLDHLLNDETRPVVQYDFYRLDSLARRPLFNETELAVLNDRQAVFSSRLHSAPPDIIRRERERITIELSWKSSQFEGNNYSLLETETLLKEGIPASGKSQFETAMSSYLFSEHLV